nr:hypothetical protein [Streptomyces sp. SID5468]
MRGAAATEPGRLRLAGLVLTALLIAFGSVTAWQVTGRAAAADDVARCSQPLSAAAAEIYRSLADANTTAAAGFLVTGQEPAVVRRRYQEDIRTAGRLIANAAESSGGSPDARAQVELLATQLPGYTGLVETARADNRQGLPLGGAYLRYADALMTGTLLPAARKLYEAENARLGQDYAAARALPWAAWTLGAVSLAALGWFQRRTYLRTNRVFNPGLLAATTAAAVTLLWLAAGHTVARDGLADAWRHGARTARILGQARIASLTARGDENLALVARGTGTGYEDAYRAGITTLGGTGDGLLARALAAADGAEDRAPVRAAAEAAARWRTRHAQAHAADVDGDYDTALALVIGGKDATGHLVPETTGTWFDQVDRDLRLAVDRGNDRFRQAAGDARGALDALPAGAVLLTVLGAAGTVTGVGRRLAEYR